MNKFLQFAIQLIKDRDHDTLARLETSVRDKAVTEVLADCVLRIHALEERLAAEKRYRLKEGVELFERLAVLETWIRKLQTKVSSIKE